MAVATYEVLPRLKKMNFDSGVTDELLYIDFPSEKKLPSGYVVLWFGKAVQQSVYKEFRIVHEGLLRVVFNPELKVCGLLVILIMHLYIADATLLYFSANYKDFPSGIVIDDILGVLCATS